MASKELDLGSVIGPQGPQGNVGPQGAQGIQGVPGKDATLNGYNTASIRGGDNVSVEDDGAGTLTLNVDQSAKQDALTFDDAPTEGSANPVKSGGVYDAIQRKPNRNFLINWYFGNPVNRNGKTEYTDEGYTIDRWTGGYNNRTVSIMDGFVRFAGVNAWFAQLIERPESYSQRTVTLSMLYKTNSTGVQLQLYAYNPVIPNNQMILQQGELDWNLASLTVKIPIFTKDTIQFRPTVIIPDGDMGSVDILAMKLELGDTQTLAHLENGVWVLNQIPDFAEQYAICEQYSPITGEFVGEQHWYRGVLDGAGPHNSVYRGANLGSAVTEEQHGHIADGTFKDLFIGDYWFIGGVTYRIAAFDYYYRAGETEDLTTHHAVIVPDTALDTQKMNDDDITVGGYTGSKMYTTYMEKAKSTITAAFGERLLTHRAIFCNAVADGHPSGYLWTNSCIELMNENMVYGTNLWLPRANGAAVYIQYTLDKGQLPLFTFRPDLISNRMDYWLRDVVSASHFAVVNDNGDASYNNASASLGVRPAFTIS